MDRSGLWAEHIKFTLPLASFPRKSPSKLSLNLQDANSSLPSFEDNSEGRQPTSEVIPKMPVPIGSQGPGLLLLQRSDLWELH